jgi:hypothetical protein
MRVREAVACGAIAVSLAAPVPCARADDAPLPPLSQARPSLPPEPAPPPVPWQQHVEVGGGVAFTQMVAGVDGNGNRTPVRFEPGVGFHIEVSWPVLRYLGFTGYLVEHDNALFLPPGALGVQALGAPGQFNPAFAHSYSFGVRVAPTIPLGSRVNLWLTAGAGWGLIQYGMTVENAARNMLPARSEDLFEIPFGLGGSVEIIPRWLSLRLEVTAAYLPSQTGSALQDNQYIGTDGLYHDFAPMPRLDVSCVETLGLMLHL